MADVPVTDHIVITVQAGSPAPDAFDFGYVLTVHKAQGSQWDDIILFDESFAFRENRGRWLYTGITRAASDLVRAYAGGAARPVYSRPTWFVTPR